MDQNKISTLLSSSTRDLYLSIGQDLVGRTLFPVGDNNLIALAKNWLALKQDSLSSLICKDERIISIFKEDNTTKRRVALVIAICDLISSLVLNVSPWTVSALLVNEGLNVLCKNYWDKDD